MSHDQVIVKNQTEGQAWVKNQQAFWQAPALVLLNGPMGAGKTQMVRWILQTLGATDAASPTFAIHHRYAGIGQSVDHFDLYRLKNDAELESSGFWDVLFESNSLVLIEWADRLPDDAYFRNRRCIFITITPQKSGADARLYSWRVVDPMTPQRR